jgi:hypothetical protein
MRERDEKCIENCGWTPEGKRVLGRPSGRSGDKIRMDLRKWFRKVWIGCIWLRTGSSGGLL